MPNIGVDETCIEKSIERIKQIQAYDRLDVIEKTISPLKIFCIVTTDFFTDLQTNRAGFYNR
jgi:hypothetical protein